MLCLSFQGFSRTRTHACPSQRSKPYNQVLGPVRRARDGRPLAGTVGTDMGSCPQVGRHGHSSVEDAMTAMELYQLVEAQWERQEASSPSTLPEDREPDSGTDMEQYMEDQYWPADLAQATSRGTEQALDQRA